MRQLRNVHEAEKSGPARVSIKHSFDVTAPIETAAEDKSDFTDVKREREETVEAKSSPTKTGCGEGEGGFLKVVASSGLRRQGLLASEW